MSDLNRFRSFMALPTVILHDAHATAQAHLKRLQQTTKTLRPTAIAQHASTQPHTQILVTHNLDAGVTGSASRYSTASSSRVMSAKRDAISPRENTCATAERSPLHSFTRCVRKLYDRASMAVAREQALVWQPVTNTVSTFSPMRYCSSGVHNF